MSFGDGELSQLIKDAKAGVELAIGYLSEMPPLDRDEQFYWNAWDALATERPQAMAGVAPIPLTSILAFADYADLTRRETDHLVQIIRAMDARLIMTASEKRKDKRNKADL